MPDYPTLILCGALTSALALFVVGAIVRAVAAPRTLPSPEGSPEQQEPESLTAETCPPPIPDSPYATPQKIEVPKAPVAWCTRGVSTGHFRAIDFLWMVFIVAVFGGMGVSSVMMKEGTELQNITPGALVGSMIFQLVLAGATIGVMVWRVRITEWLGLKWRAWPWVFLIGPVAVISMWGVMGLLQGAGYMKWVESLGGEGVQDTVKLLQESKDPIILTLMALAAVVVAPVCEEILFRGYLYAAAKRFAGPWVAAISSCLIFAAAHGSLPALLPLFLLALLLVFLYEKTGSLWAPIAVHFCFNGATVMIQLILRYFNLPVDATP